MLQYLVAGLATGASYGLLAMAIVVIFKSTNIPNFATAEMGLFATYVAATCLNHGLPWAVCLLVLLVTAGLLGAVVEKLLIGRFLGKPHYVTIMLTLALYFSINSITTQIWGENTVSVTPPYAGTWHIGTADVTTQQVALLVTFAVIWVALILLFRTPVGLHMRAIAMDNVVPRLLGVSVSRLALLAWIVGGMIAGLALFFHVQTTALSPQSGDDILLSSFVGATLGGFSSVSGAALGGLALGLIEALAGGYISSTAQTSVALIVVLVALILRPRGVLGEAAGRAA
jgi:branched-chain amino acid transport system permease protein